jgi:hypothetical protein
MQRAAATGEQAARLRSACDDIDVLDLLPRVSVPTLVIHASKDNVVPFDKGRTPARDHAGRLPRSSSPLKSLSSDRDGAMEVTGAPLLYTLATLAITFAGFAVLLLALRQAAGAPLSTLDRFLARTVVGHFFWIAAGALFPAALGLYTESSPFIWKTSALLFGLPMLGILLSYPRRRFAVTGKRAPPSILILFLGAGSLSTAIMIASVFSGFSHPAAAYASAILVNFVAHGIAVVVALEVILRQQERVTKAVKPASRRAHF